MTVFVETEVVVILFEDVARAMDAGNCRTARVVAILAKVPRPLALP
jgi:hypothetical protein